MASVRCRRSSGLQYRIDGFGGFWNYIGREDELHDHLEAGLRNPPHAWAKRPVSERTLLWLVVPVLSLLVLGVAGCQQSPGRGERTTGAAATGDASPSPRTTVFRDSRPTCAACEIQLTPVGSFGALEDSILLRNIPIVERDSRGLLYATVRAARDHEVIVFAPGGEILRTIGGPGEGPGEFRTVWDILVGAGDSLLVGHGGTVSVFDPSGRFARSVRLDRASSFQRHFVRADADRIVLTELRASRSPVQPLQIYDEQGRHLRSVGPPDLRAILHAGRSGTDRGSLVSGMRRTGSQADGAVWLVASTGGYRLERVAPDGRVGRTIGVVAPAAWNVEPLLMNLAEAEARLPAPSRRDGPTRPHRSRAASAERRPEVEPPGFVRDVSVAERGLLVVILHVAAENWQEARVALDTTVVPAVAEAGYEQQIHDTIIDVLDIATGDVVARRRVDGTLYSTSGGDLYRPSVAPTGVIGVEVFEVDLESFR